MFALMKRNIKIYFANKPGVVMSCFGALISFVIYIGFLQQNLVDSWQNVSHAKQLLDLWMLGGIVSIAGITTSFQALGQMVKDRESRAIDDIKLTNLTPISECMAYVASALIISFLMQVITFLVMAIYFSVVDKVNIQSTVYLPALGFMLLGAIGATLLNLVIVLFINSSTTFSRLSAVIGAAAGFMVATYMPYGTLSKTAQNIVKLFPSSYEAASFRSLLLNKLSQEDVPDEMRQKLIEYLGIHFKFGSHQLTNGDNALVIIAMSLLLTVIVICLAVMLDRKKN
ncbi:ABC transporter permease [Lactobacillus crispatus]|jgi:ABC transporter|uniref:ABC transporter permease n=1 Tax=Lactobacillus crispatus TaxID=47770 RepID=UPI0001B29875|nr:ABC transporter permease [Lactobacillus crispatus]EEU19387.1 ABC-2 type transporter [Lactobacillus crispatus 125-2-CHN]EEX30248.1 ABC-2 type transporter [Lactobacillus crispatus MV-3A-US]KWU09130.1 multidrug ABC transporter permease [Lactobacillus crispatus]MCT7711364.1 ABC transporter permease [Lactobacillus crispatus]MCT7713390.1 ABC transporter permease [Lactobacillus crispatus]